MRASSSRPHLNLITSQRPHLQILLQWGLGFQHMSGGGTNIQTIATSNQIPPSKFASTYPLTLLVGYKYPLILVILRIEFSLSPVLQ